MSLPQSFCYAKIQPCRARAPFVRFADIFPANGEICPRQRGLGRYHPYTPVLVNAHYTGHSIMEIKLDKGLVPLSFLQYVLK